MKRPSFRLLVISLCAGLIAGCAPQRPATTGPSPREAELMKTVDELREQLAAAEQATAQAKAETARALAMIPPQPAPPPPVAPAVPPAAVAGAVADSQYIVVKKTLTPGQLIPKATASNPNQTERRPAQYHIVFKGAQSGKEYPALEVQELAYSRFREGITYSAQDLNEAKKPAPIASGSPQPTGGSGNIDPELRALFGN